MEPLKSNTIILLGMHQPTLDRWDYQKSHGEGHEIWGMAHHDHTLIHATRAFESHCFEIVVNSGGIGHVNRLKKIAHEMPLYTPWDWPLALGPQHETFPHHELAAITERLESSIAFMMAVAINALLDDDSCNTRAYLGETRRIELYGIDMAAVDEYAYQRPNMQYLIGFARGVGIEVVVPDNSSLFKSFWQGGFYGSPQDLNTIPYYLKPAEPVSYEEAS